MADSTVSRRNPRVRAVRRLLREPKERRDAGLWVVEGPHLVAEVLREDIPIQLWILTPDQQADPSIRGEVRARGQETLFVDEDTFLELSDTRAPRGVLCVIEAPAWSLEEVLSRPGPLLALDGVQDPGNLGTLVRSAEAAGAAGLLLGPACVDAGNPKALRASAGSLLRVPTVAVADLVAAVHRRGRAVYGTTGRHGAPYDAVDLTGAFVLLVGQEGRGLSPELLSISDVTLTIPMAGKVESLNAATAASVVLFEASRQRRALVRSS